MKTLISFAFFFCAIAVSAQVKTTQHFTVYKINQDGLPIDSNGIVVDGCNAYPKMIIKDRCVVFKTQQAYELKMEELADRRKPIDSLYLDALNKVFLK